MCYYNKAQKGGFMSQLKRKGPIAKVNEVARKTGTTISWVRTDDRHQIICHLNEVEIKISSALESPSGYGKTRTSAAASYFRKIVGQLLVKNAFAEDRQYFVVVNLKGQIKVIVIPKD